MLRSSWRWIGSGWRRWAVSSMRVGFAPIALTTASFNQDMVVEKTAPAPIAPGGYTSASMDAGIGNSGTTWYERGYNASASTTGLPAAGTTFVSQTSSTHSYRMAPSYTANNAILLDAILTNATFTVVTPVACSHLSFLESGGHNGVTFRYTVHHQTGAADTGTASIPDWFSNGTNRAWTANGRVDAQSLAPENINSGDPQLYSLDINLANTASPVTSVDLAYVSGGGEGAILAISGGTGSAYAPVPVTGYNEDIVVEAGAPKPGALNGYTTATMDTGTTNTETTWYEAGYAPEALDSGLPAAGSLLTNLSAPDHVYAMPPSYTLNNAILLTTNSAPVKATFAMASNYPALSFLIASGNGPVTVGCRIAHASGATESNYFIAPDWYAGSPTALAANGRVNVSDKTLSFLNDNNPRLYAADISLANTVSPVTSVTSSWLAGAGNGNAVIFAVSGGSPSPPLAEDDFNANTAAATQTLQQWYNDSGLYNSTAWWNAANCVEALENTVFANNSMDLLGVVSNTFLLNSNGNYLNYYYDDEQWWANAWIRAYDQTGNTNFLSMAKTIFADIVGGWNTECNGGVWWSKADNAKNAVENGLFILTAIRLHQRSPGDTGASGSYLYWATNAWAWCKASGLINSENLVNDGLDLSNCQNNDGPTFSYNQGLLIGALTDLYKATGSSNYLTDATAIANAVLAHLVDSKGVFVEASPCDPTCGGGDVPQFKGICVRYIAYLYDLTRSPSYYNFLQKAAHAVWFNDRNNFNQLGMSWDGPFDSADAARQSSAIMALSALAEPITTNLVFAKGSGDPAFSHAVGSRAGTLAWLCGPANAAAAGYAQTGPHITYLSPGLHAVHFQIAADSINSSASSLATLDVFDDSQSQVLASGAVPWSAFREAGKPHDFVLLFTNTTVSDPLEFRVYWNNAPGGPNLTISDVTVDGLLNWTGANLTHDIGQLDGLNAWQADRFSATNSGYMARGPGAMEIPPGDYTALLELRVDNFNADNSGVATISVVDLDNGATLAARTLTRNQFPNTLYQSFALNFTAAPATHYDFRVYWYRTANPPRLTLRSVLLRPGPTPFFTSAQIANNSIALNFAGTPGQTYALQATSSLLAPLWQTIQSVTVPANLGFAQAIDTPPASGRFYRLSAP